MLICLARIRNFHIHVQVFCCNVLSLQASFQILFSFEMLSLLDVSKKICVLLIVHSHKIIVAFVNAIAYISAVINSY
jgi:hypothetical protein